MKIHISVISLFLTGACAYGPGVQAQDTPVSAASVEEKATRLIQAKKSLSSEASAWEEQKQLFTDLIAVREKEIAGIDEFTESATGRIAEIKQKRSELVEEETARKEWRANFEKTLTDLETSLRARVLRFPPPLRDKIEESILRLEEADPETPLQNRIRDVASILNAAIEFQNNITVSSEIREVGDDSVEVDILYLGLARAWFVDRSGRIAGTGVPTDLGWVWQDDPRFAPGIRNAIQIHNKETSPGFVKLPFPISETPSK